MKPILQSSQMKKIIVIIIILGILSSCSTYKATVRQHEDLDYGAMKVTPEWEYIDHKGSKKLIRGIGLISGGIYGYTNETTINGKTYTGFENAAPWGIIGYIGGAIITSVVFQKENPNKATFNISQSDKWLNEFNQSTGNNYLLNSKNLDNTLVLIPQSNVEALRYEYKLLEEDLKRSSPITNFQTLKNWEIKLTKEFSYLPADELSNLKSLISENKQKLADKELKVYAKEIEQLANEEESLATIERLRRNSQDLYYAASYDGQIEYKNTMQEKIGKILNIIVSDEQKKLSAYGNELVDLETINSSIPAIDKKFSDYEGNSDVDNYYMLLNSKVSNILKFNRTKIKTLINGFNDLEKLDGFTNKYLSNVSKDLPEVQEATQLIKSRKEEIIENNRKLKAAEDEARRSRFNEARRIIREREAENDRKAKEVAQIRESLNKKYDTYFPTLDDLEDVLFLLLPITDTYYVSDEEALVRQINNLGYSKSEDGLGHYNSFYNNRGFSLKTIRSKDNEKSFASVFLSFPNYKNELFDLYKSELLSEYRLSKGSVNPNELQPGAGYSRIKSGSTLFYYRIKGSTLEVEAVYNYNGDFRIINERLNSYALKVDSYSDFTDIKVSKGDIIKFEAEGNVSLWDGAGNSSPDGIIGYGSSSITSRFKHGCLMGKIDEGEWFYIGTSNTITVADPGRLVLRINDRDASNNSGYYIVTSKIDKKQDSY